MKAKSTIFSCRITKPRKCACPWKYKVSSSDWKRKILICFKHIFGQNVFLRSIVILLLILSGKCTSIKKTQKGNLTLRNLVPLYCDDFYLILYLWQHFASLKLYLYWNFTINMLNWCLFYKFLIYELTVFCLVGLSRGSGYFISPLTTCLTLHWQSATKNILFIVFTWSAWIHCCPFTTITLSYWVINTFYWSFQW